MQPLLKNALKLITITAVLLLSGSATLQAQTIDWIRQLGSIGDDRSTGISADGFGNVYISGNTNWILDGTNPGGDDAFIAKYTSNGALAWTRQLGERSYEASSGVSIDGSGGVYLSGTTDGSLDSFGSFYTDSLDTIISKYTTSGRLIRTKQYGTSKLDISTGVSTDGLGSVYLSGYSYGSIGGNNIGGTDAFVSKYSGYGARIWTRQLGTAIHDWSNGVSADGLGNVYISGGTKGSLGGTNVGSHDVFIAKYTSDGVLAWTRQLGTNARDESHGVSADGLGNVYITGWTIGSFDGANAGGTDAFIAKYTSDGALAWTRQFGSSSGESSYGVSADGFGNIYISGHTGGSLDGANVGKADAFVTKYTSDGAFGWTKQLGTSSYDSSFAISADGLGNVYISGVTSGSLSGISAGGNDAFIVKIIDEGFTGVPEPGTVVLTLFALGGLLSVRHKHV